MTATAKLLHTTEYVEAYELGKSHAIAKKNKDNPFGVENTEKHSGYEDGYYDNKFK